MYLYFFSPEYLQQLYQNEIIYNQMKTSGVNKYQFRAHALYDYRPATVFYM